MYGAVSPVTSASAQLKYFQIVLNIHLNYYCENSDCTYMYMQVLSLNNVCTLYLAKPVSNLVLVLKSFH